MKKILAIFLTVVLLFSVGVFNSSATEEPKVSIITNVGSPVAENTTILFTVRFDNFSAIKGVDVTVTANGSTTLGEVTTYNFKGSTGEGDVNFVRENNDQTLRFVDLLKSGANNARLSIAATVASTSDTITVTGTYAASGVKLFEGISDANGTIVVKPAEIEEPDKVPNEQIDEEKGTFTPPTTKDTFVPMGSVYKPVTDEQGNTTYVFADKNANGSFNVGGDTDYVYDTFEVPENGITTYGISHDLNHPELLRFGNYSSVYNANNKSLEHGTMVFEGDWLALKNYYIQRGYKVEEFVKVLYNNASTILSKPENKEATHVFYNVPTSSGTTTVKLYLFKQTKYLWKDDANGILEYAIRLHGTTAGFTYTGIAYSVNNGSAVISKDVKSILAQTNVVS